MMSLNYVREDGTYRPLTSLEPDAVVLELRKRAEEATEAQLVRMLVELALLRSGYSDEMLEPTDLVSAARRYSAVPESKETPQPKAAKCAPKSDRVPSNPKRPKARADHIQVGRKIENAERRSGLARSSTGSRH